MRVLILDRSHAVLLENGRLPEVPWDGAPPLRSVQNALAARGVTLPSPAGSLANPQGGRDFAFLIDRCEAPAGMTWRPLRACAADEAVWTLYVALLLGGYIPPTRALDVWSFGDSPLMASQLVHLVVCGTKRVTMGWVDAAERDGTPLPYQGGISIVTDGFGYPRVCLRSTEVRVVRFDEVTPEDAAGEGEGDLTYEDWRAGHTQYFTREAARLGLLFDAAARIAVERFEVLGVIGSSAAPRSEPAGSEPAGS
jgi:uncharacterized protein YhfF